MNAAALDPRTYYLVAQKFSASTVLVETEIDPLPDTAEQIAERILGRDIENPTKVLAINEADGTCRNVSAEIATLVIRAADRRNWISEEVAQWCESYGAKVLHTISVEAA